MDTWASAAGQAKAGMNFDLVELGNHDQQNGVLISYVHVCHLVLHALWCWSSFRVHQRCQAVRLSLHSLAILVF